MWRALVLCSLFVLGACTVAEDPARGGSTQTKPEQKYGMQMGALVEDSKGNPMAPVSSPTDPSCYGIDKSGKRMIMPDAQMLCRVWYADDGGTYDAKAKTVTVTYGPGASDSDCDDKDDNTTDKCIVTQDTSPNCTCFNLLQPCTSAMADSNCGTVGWKAPDGKGGYACSAVPNMQKAQPESCDGKDNNCDGKTDETFAVGQACDGTDSDQCKNGVFACTTDGSGVACGTESKTDIKEVCDSQDNNCDGNVDEGFTLNGVGLGKACDAPEDGDLCADTVVICAADGKSAICKPGVTIVEICDGADNDCNSKTDEGCDDDADGYCDMSMKMSKTATCAQSKLPSDSSYIPGDDCNDDLKAGGDKVHPGVTELCNAVDDDCNSKTDESFTMGVSCTAADMGFKGECGKPAGVTIGCSADGKNTVCNAIPAKATSEVCDGLDNDCDGVTDNGCDDDKDGYCDAAMKVAKGAACSKSKIPSDASQVSGDDCTDTDKLINPGANELCDGKDNNCSTVVDEGCDDDKDGYCDASMVYINTAACKLGGDGGVADCDDADPSIHPDAVESCDGKDNDCDGATDKVGNNTVCGGGSKCELAIKVKCGQTITLDSGSNPNGTDAVETYTYQTNAGPKTDKGQTGKELIVAVDGLPGQPYTLAFSDYVFDTYTFNGACGPDDAKNKTANLYDATKGTGVVTTKGFVSAKGVVGKTWQVLEGTGKVSVTAVCGKAP